MAAIAAASEWKWPTAKRLADGSVTRPTVAAVIATNVPSEPVTSFARSNSCASRSSR